MNATSIKIKIKTTHHTEDSARKREMLHTMTQGFGTLLTSNKDGTKNRSNHHVRLKNSPPVQLKEADKLMIKHYTPFRAHGGGSTLANYTENHAATTKATQSQQNPQ